MRGFDRAAAQALSWETGLPVILAAVGLKGAQLLCGGSPARGDAARPIAPTALAVGCASAFVSTLASARALRRGRRSGRALAPYAAYRLALALAVLVRGRRRERGA
jgi:undecaprenyl pyrophosphate phosphatase UppP